jgi:hypothetical protein
VRWLARGLAAALLLGGGSGRAVASAPTTRHPTGAQTLRGTAGAVTSHGFTLTSPSKGSFSVQVTANTQVDESGVKGRVSVHDGDHVGVHGFVRGRTIAAITVKVYPSHAAPKPYSVRGSVASVARGTITIAVGGKQINARWTAASTVTTSAGSATSAAVRTGSSVEVRLQPGKPLPAILHVHVYGSAAPKRHVKLNGTVLTSSGGSFVVQVGSRRYAVRAGSGMKVYDGAKHETHPEVPAGRMATVYACCQGAPLVATSVHLAAVHTTTTSVLIRGSLTATRAGALTLNVSGHPTAVSVTRSTRYELGSTAISRSGLRVGDYVSVRGTRRGASLVATRVHVYAAYRETLSLRGAVTAVGRNTVSVKSRGKIVVVQLPASARVTRGSSHIAANQLHRGDNVTVAARLTAPGTYVATAIVVAVPPPVTQSISGTVTQLARTTLQVAPSKGPRVTIFIGGVRPRLASGAAAPPGALFPGVHVRVHATQSGRTWRATSVDVTLTVRDISGRLMSVGPTWLGIRPGATTVDHLTVAPGLRVTDGGRHLAASSLHVGAFVSVHVYEANSRMLRAVDVTVLHPTLDMPAHVVSARGRMTVMTTAGERYQLHFTHGTPIVTARTALPLTRHQIPNSASVHVVGIVRSDGGVQVHSLVVTLSSVSVRATVQSVGQKSMTISPQAGDATRARLTSQTRVTQGASPLLVSDIVPGDDVTIDGYTIRGGLLARAIAVHRRLLGLTGTIAALTSGGFTLDTADGRHGVLVFTTTIFTGFTGPGDVVAGITVHVTGYLRGDGVVLATRVRKGA